MIRRIRAVGAAIAVVVATIAFVAISPPASAAPPTVSFTASPTSGTAPLTVTFTDTTTGTASSYAWTFGDGATSTAKSTSHVFQRPGTYTVFHSATNADGKTTTSKTITVSPRFPGDPGNGQILSGTTIADGNGGDNADLLDSKISGDKRHLLARIYQLNSTGFIDWNQIDAQIAKGRLPLVSAKYYVQDKDTKQITSGWTPAQVAAGAADAQLAKDAAAFKARAPHPIWFDYIHEPFDDWPASNGTSASFRQAYRHVVDYFRAAGVTNVAYYGPTTMVDYEYVPAGVAARGGEAYNADPDWKGTKSCVVSGVATPCAADWYTGSQAVIDILGIDEYSYGATGYDLFSNRFRTFKTKLTTWQRPWKPVVVAEIGTRNPSGETEDWAAWWADARGTMLASSNTIIGYSYFNLGTTQFDPSYTSPQFVAYAGFFNNASVVGAP